ncbi:hypothetical protein BWQ96_08368 [Gracilariopsis chorda]|uniref:Uncharacterized protein n=1 Tax=Gracilariopsis chorda TaxID=448386 RepID=A0A2V3IIJ7_9FLOR|nr:hypothetical protein BWQ96_08368 [Gracilariopsis chorda]|eukprot:PXF41916.1 hypothetical protein BWQ96_08368 [Gracilariopsis chorda]
MALVQVEDESDMGVGYREFSRQLLSKVSNLLVRKEFCSETEQLGVEMLEWLTILIYMGRRSVKLREEHLEKHEKSNGKEGTDSGHSADGSAADDGLVYDESLDQAMRNLREQLSCPVRYHSGIEDNEKGNESEQKIALPSFPFQTNWRGVISRNSHVLEVVDVWLEIIAGDGLRFVLELNEKWSVLCRGRKYEDVGQVKYADASDRSTKTENSDGHTAQSCDVRLQNVHKELGKLRLRYQFGDDDCKCTWGVSYGMAFMGYKMETVRSHLAEWVYQLRGEVDSERNGSSRFRQSLEDTENGVYSMSKSCVLSDTLSRSFKYGAMKSTLRSRQFQVRLLWELQEHFEESVQIQGECNKKTTPQYGPEMFEAIALCVLSFSSLSVEVKDESGVECPAVRTRDWYGICIGCCSEQQLGNRVATDDTN